MIPAHIRPVKGKKVVAHRLREEERVGRNWRGQVTRREVRSVLFALHPTKGWRRVWAEPWRLV